MVKRVERPADAGPDRRRTGGGHLLAADDVSKACEARLAPPQRRHAGKVKNRLEPRIMLHQRGDGAVEVGLGVEVDGHWALGSSCAGLTRASISYRNRLLLAMDCRIKSGNDKC